MGISSIFIHPDDPVVRPRSAPGVAFSARPSPGASMTASAFPRWLIAAGAALSLAACGGGGDGPAATPAPTAAATGGTQFATGAITGFGSVFVEGVRYDDSRATIRFEDDSAAPRLAAVSALRLGMQVEVLADDSDRAASVTVSSEVRGRITALASDGFTAAGQVVKVSADPANPTVFDGVAGLAGLALNDVVEVHGRRDAAGAIVASRIERKDAGTFTAIRVAGTVAGLDATARTFTVGGLTVRHEPTTRLLPAGAVLADGQRVAVWSDAAIVGNTLLARSIVVRRHDPGVGDSARVGGFVRKLDFAARTFEIDGIPVDAAGARYEKGSASDLANGRKVRVRGRFVEGRLTATEVRFVKDRGDANVELTGVVTDFAGAGSFKVRGVPIDASGAGIAFRNGSTANLANGVLIKVEGDVDGSVVRPRELTFVTSADGRGRWLLGEVAGYNSGSGAFRLMGLDARLSDRTTFRNGDGTPAVRAEFGDGDRVQVRGAFAAGVFDVAEVVFRPGAQVVVDTIEGGVYEVDITAGTFRLNGTLVRIGPTTVFEGTGGMLRNGMTVEVHVTVVGGQLVASKIEARSPEGFDGERVKGFISEFVSPADFRVAGQRVDASTAGYDPSTLDASQLAEGRYVEITGSMVAGVVKATKVAFE
jgi:hypothetical protein